MKSLFKKTLSLVLAFMMMVSVVSAPSAYAAIKYPVGDTSEYEVSATFVEADGTTEAETIKPGEDAYLKLELKNFSTLNSGYAAITLDGGTFEEEYNVLKDSVFAKDDLISEFNAGTGNVIYGLATDVENLTSINKKVKYYAFAEPTDLPLAVYRISVDEDATEVVATVSQNLKLGDANGATGNIAATAEGIILTGDTIIKKEEENSVVGIKILQKPYKTKYYVGESLVTDGLRVAAEYSNGETVEIFDYTVSELDSASMGLVTVTYEGFSAQFMVTIADPVLKEGTCGDNLTWILYDNGVLTISGTGAMTTFTGKTNLPWYEYLNNIKIINIEEGVTTIGSHAFRECPNLTYVSLPNTLTTVGYSVFVKCTSLKSIELPDSITTLNAHTFYECSALESVKLPSKIKNIGETTFFTCKKLNNIVIPDSVTSIGKNAFRGCSSLESIVIPPNVTTINTGAFSYCTKLTSITLYNKIKTISGTAFTASNALKNVIFHGTKTEWGNITIGADNTSLTSAAIDYMIEDCIAHGTCGTNLNWRLEFDGTLNIKGNGEMKSYSTYSDVPWYNYADQIKSVVVEEGVTTIGNWAFYLLKKVTSVSLPEGLTLIGSNSFRGCSSLTEIRIPTTVTKIDYAALSYCSKLSTVYLYNNLKTIGSSAFVSCSVLNHIYYEGTRAEWNSISIATGNDNLTGANIYVTPVITNINVKTLPYKTVYELGEEFNTEGLIITADYDDGVTKEISDFKVSGFDSETPGEKVITVTFGEFETTFTVVIKEPVVMTGISANIDSVKTVYSYGEELDLTGLVVEALYSDNSYTELNTTEYTVSGYDPYKAGENVVTITYGDFTAVFTVTVVVEVTGIAIKSLPEKIVYFEGEEIDLTGLVVEALYSDKTSKELNTAEYTVTGLDTLAAGDNVITVTYGDYSVTFTVDVMRIEETGVKITSMPDKLVYKYGEELDLTGLVLTAFYSNGTQEDVSGYNVTGYDPYTPGDKIIKVTYGEFSDEFTVTVVVEVTGIAIKSLPEKIVYFEGEEIDLTGLVVEAIYSDKTSKELNTAEYTISDYDSLIVGENVITVYYGDITTEFIITVNAYVPPTPAKLIELRLESLPYKTEYVVGEELDLTGVKVMADYDDGTSKEITEYDVSEYDPTTPGTQIIGLAYEEHMVTFEVVVRNANTDSSIKYPLGDTSDYEVSATFVNENGEKVESVNRGEKVYMLLELKNFKTLNAGFVKVELDGATILSEQDMLTNSIFFKDYDMSVSGLGDNKVVYGLSTHVSNLTEINQNVRYHKFDGPTDLVLALYEIEPYATVTQVHANVSHNLKVGDANGLTGNIPATAEDLIIRGDDVVIENAPIPTYENPTITLSDEMFNQYPSLEEFVARLNVTVQEFVNGEYYRTVDLAYSAGDFDILFNADHNAVVTFMGKYATLPSITVFFEVAPAPDVVTYGNATATLTNNIFDRQPTTADFVARLKVTVDEFVNGVYNQTIELPLSSVTYGIVFDTVTNVAMITFADKYVEVPGITLSYTITAPDVVTYNGKAELNNNVFTHIPSIAEFIAKLNVSVDKFVNGAFVQTIKLSHSAGDYDVVINTESNHAVITFMGAYADTPSLAVPFTVVPQDIPVITVDSVRANAGGTVDVAISIENNPGILGMQLDLGFDSRLKLVDIFRPSGAALSGLDFTKPGILDSTIPLVLPIEGMYADDSNGNFLVLRFEVSDFAQYGDEYHISLGYANGNIYDNDLNDIVCNIINGKITIEGFTLGDVNKDGKVDEEDITTLQKGIAGGYGIVLDMAADLNSDGIYNIKDITLLRRLIANMGSLITPSPSTPEVEIEG